MKKEVVDNLHNSTDDRAAGRPPILKRGDLVVDLGAADDTDSGTTRIIKLPDGTLRTVSKQMLKDPVTK